jgi:tripartite-type tricarboxylate transporter receptor subunit TctC
LASAPVVLAVNPAVPANTLREFIALARNKDKAVAYGSAGSGSPGHLTGALFADATRADLLHVPYKGSAPAISDLLSGQIPAMFDPVQSPLANIRAGKLRALAVSGSKRSNVLPDVPTMAEAGVPGFEAEAWWGLFAPAGLPPEIRNKLQAETSKIMRSAEVREQLGKLGIESIGSSSGDLRAFVETEVSKWAKAVKSSGATVD